MIALATLIAAVVGILAFVGGVLVGELRQRKASFELVALWRTQSETWQQQAMERQAVIDKMRLDGYAIQKKAIVTEAPDPEAEGLRRAEYQATLRRSDREFIRRATDDILKNRPGVSRAEAEREAIRLRRETQMEDPPA